MRYGSKAFPGHYSCKEIDCEATINIKQINFGKEHESSDSSKKGREEESTDCN